MLNMLKMIVEEFKLRRKWKRQQKMLEDMRLRITTFDPLAKFRPDDCEASFMKTGDWCYDQSKAILDFCPPNARKEGCLKCKYCPEKYRGLLSREYMKLVRHGKKPQGRMTIEEAGKIGVVDLTRR